MLPVAAGKLVFWEPSFASESIRECLGCDRVGPHFLKVTVAEHFLLAPTNILDSAKESV